MLQTEKDIHAAPLVTVRFYTAPSTPTTTGGGPSGGGGGGIGGATKAGSGAQECDAVTVDTKVGELGKEIE